eukprot:6195345-Pleurochrysis_carterae.AAC.3
MHFRCPDGATANEGNRRNSDVAFAGGSSSSCPEVLVNTSYVCSLRRSDNEDSAQRARCVAEHALPSVPDEELLPKSNCHTARASIDRRAQLLHLGVAEEARRAPPHDNVVDVLSQAAVQAAGHAGMAPAEHGLLQAARKDGQE